MWPWQATQTRLRPLRLALYSAWSAALKQDWSLQAALKGAMPMLTVMRISFGVSLSNTTG